jgi:N-glycosylase/DNA lyase
LDAGEYHLAATLDSGQAFRWVRRADGAWEGVIGRRWVEISDIGGGRLEVGAQEDPGDWGWLRAYLGVDDDPVAIARTFPPDPQLREAVSAFPGLRVLRQDPWECLASFILSSTKRIVQIRQVVGMLCERFGEVVDVPSGHHPEHSFPKAAALASAGEDALRGCRMGFRARYLHATAVRVASGALDPDRLSRLGLPLARAELMACPGVGRKIADCVLLFSCGYPAAFPVDVWVLRALRELYFPTRRPNPARLLAFSESHFGPYGGHAQQHLFHYFRTRSVRPASVRRTGGVASGGGFGAA